MNKLALIAVIILLIPTISSSENFDLCVKWVKVSRSVVAEGEIVEIEAKVEGNGVSRPFNVYFYVDVANPEHLIGVKSYESINRYRLPKIEFDTKDYEGKHVIIAEVYDANQSNNVAKCNITIYKIKPFYGILIKEFYYYAYPNKNNEFVCIYNCGNDTFLGDYYLTTQPWKRADKQNKVFLPGIWLKHGQTIYVTQNGSSFLKEMGFEPDYEYYDCSSISDLKRKGAFHMSNNGGVIAIKDFTNHTIDCAVYGNFSYGEGWNGRQLYANRGFIVKRNNCIDTNSSNDWKIIKIGWTDFRPYNFTANHAIAFCSPDCSYDVVGKTINGKNITINMYMFTHPYIYKILMKNNATIRILLDGNVIGGIPLNERYIAWKLSKKAIIRYMFGNEREGIYKRYKFDHAKYVIIDNKSIIESANWVMSGIPVNPSYGNREWGIVIYSSNLSKFLWKVFSSDFNAVMEDILPFNEKDFLKGKPLNFSITYFVPHGGYKKKFKPFEINEKFKGCIILSPDNAEKQICNLISGAKSEILVEQAYIQKFWHGKLNPFLEKLVEKRKKGIKIKVLINYNPRYKSTNKMNEETLKFLKENGIDAKFSRIPIHNKGLIVDNKVLISSINWGENSVRNNREIGIIIENNDVSNYFKKIFYYDWNYGIVKHHYEYIFITILFAITILIIYMERRRR